MQNIVILAGNLGQSPESRTAGNGKTVTTFSLATSRPRYKDGKVVRNEKTGYREQDTEWHRVVTFDGLAKTVQKHCEKGMKVLVRGRLSYSKWTDNEGKERFSVEIIAETVDFLSRAKPSTKDENDLDDEIPF